MQKTIEDKDVNNDGITDILFPFDSKALTTGAVARVKMDQWLYTQVNSRRVAHAESVKIAAES